MRELLTTTCIFLLLVLSCTKEDKQSITNDEILKSDYELVHQWIFNDYKPEMNPSLEFTLKNITTTEIRDQLDARVYSIVCDVPGLGDRGVFVKEDVVYDLGRYNLMGASEPNDLLVADLNNDQKYELYYSITHGSGILRTNILCYMDESEDILLPAAGSFYFPIDYSIGLQKTNDNKHINVFFNSGSTRQNIGEIELFEVGDSLQCSVVLKDDIPQSIKDAINGN